MRLTAKRAAAVAAFVAVCGVGTPLIDTIIKPFSGRVTSIGSVANAQSPSPLDTEPDMCRPKELVGLEAKLGRSKVVVIPEWHTDIYFYSQLISFLSELKKDHNLKTIFVELDRDLNGSVAEYQRLTAILLKDPDMDRKKRGKIDLERNRHMERILGRMPVPFDIRKRGFLIALLDISSAAGIKVVFTDLSDKALDAREGPQAHKRALDPRILDLRERTIVDTIVANMPKDGTTIALNGEIHAVHLISLLQSRGLKAE